MSDANKEEPFENQFVFLDREFAKEARGGRYKPVIFSDNFQKMLDELTKLRIEVGYERMSVGDAAIKAIELEKAHGFESQISFSDKGISTGNYYSKIEDEIYKLGCRLPESSDSDYHRYRSDTSVIRDDVYRATACLSLKPIKPVRLELNDIGAQVKKDVVASLEKATGMKVSFKDAVNDSQIDDLVTGILRQKEPDLAKQHVLIEPNIAA